MLSLLPLPLPPPLLKINLARLGLSTALLHEILYDICIVIAQEIWRVCSFVDLLTGLPVLLLNNDLFSSLNSIYMEFMFVRIQWNENHFTHWSETELTHNTHKHKWFIFPILYIRTHLILATRCQKDLSNLMSTQLYYMSNFKRWIFCQALQWNGIANFPLLFPPFTIDFVYFGDFYTQTFLRLMWFIVIVGCRRYNSIALRYLHRFQVLSRAVAVLLFFSFVHTLLS